MAKMIDQITIKVAYDMKDVREALRSERQWYLEAFEMIECAFEGVANFDDPRHERAIAACRDRMRALYEELND